MLDAFFRRIIDPPLDKVGRKLAGFGVSANRVTIGGFVIGMAALPAIAYERYDWALFFIVINRIGDGLDGAIARYSKISDIGGYLDIVCDFIFYSAVVFGFALASPDNAVAAAFLIFSFIGTGTSFLTYAIMAEKRKITTDFRGKKSLYYLGGLTEGTETILIMILFCLFPRHFSTLAFVFAGLCWLTTASRTVTAWHMFR